MSRTSLPQNERRVDYYPTPAWCVRRLLESVKLPGGCWLEPAVGDGAIVRAVDELRDDVNWTTVDIRPEVRPDLIADFTWMGCPELLDQSFVVAVTNPPFSQAEAFVRNSQVRAFVTVMLLRLAWLESAERAFWLGHNAPDVYVLPNRPSFVGTTRTDSAAYAWMIWWSREVRRRGRIQVLEVTPLEERRTA